MTWKFLSNLYLALYAFFDIYIYITKQQLQITPAVQANAYVWLTKTDLKNTQKHTHAQRHNNLLCIIVFLFWWSDLSSFPIGNRTGFELLTTRDVPLCCQIIESTATVGARDKVWVVWWRRRWQIFEGHTLLLHLLHLLGIADVGYKLLMLMSPIILLFLLQYPDISWLSMVVTLLTSGGMWQRWAMWISQSYVCKCDQNFEQLVFPRKFTVCVCGRERGAGVCVI